MRKVITLGADPEAVLWDIKTGKIIGAYDAGFPQHSNAGTIIEKAVLKCDGCSSTFEIETPPFTTAAAGVEIFRGAITELKNYRPRQLDFFGGSRVGKVSIGGHLHASMDKEDNLIKMLDNTLGHLSFIVSGKNQWQRVKSGSYGRYGDIRPQNHGFEYRTPPSWLISEEWTLAFLSFFYTVCHAYDENKDLCVKKLAGIKGQNPTKRTVLLSMLRFYKSEFPHLYYANELSPIFRIITNHQTWLAIDDPKPENCSMKRWKL